jgi:hypothetical protein
MNWRIQFLINHALACHLQGNETRAAAILNAEDWSAKELKFKLAATVIRKKYDAAEKLMTEVGKAIHRADYRNWPLFTLFRETVQFKRAFKAIFNEEAAVTEHFLPESPKSAKEEIADRKEKEKIQ